MSFKESKELESLEKEIADLENALLAKNDQLNKTGIKPGELNDTLKQIAELTSKLDEKSIRWIELTELK